MTISLTQRMRRSLMALAMVGPLAVMGVLVCAQPQGDAKGPTAKEKYKNIKVLTKLPADQLIPTMRAWNEALGVRCDYCHE